MSGSGFNAQSQNWVVVREVAPISAGRGLGSGSLIA